MHLFDVPLDPPLLKGFVTRDYDLNENETGLDKKIIRERGIHSLIFIFHSPLKTIFHSRKILAHSAQKQETG